MSTSLTMTDVLNLSWGGPSYASYEGKQSSAPVTTPIADTGSQPAGDSGAGAPTASPAADGKPASSTGTAPNNDQNIAVLRKSHEELTGKWQKLGEYDHVSSRLSVIGKMETESSTLAQRLGYDQQDFNDAFAADPVKTLSILRQEAMEAAKRQDPDGSGRRIEELVKRAVEQQTKPLTEEHNRQLTEKANTVFTNEVNRLISAEYKDAPQGVSNFLSDMVSEILKYDEKGLVDLKVHGKVAPVQAAFNVAKDMFLRAVTDYNSWQQKSQPIGNKVTPGAAEEKMSLDDIINGAPVATKRLSTFR